MLWRNGFTDGRRLRIGTRAGEEQWAMALYDKTNGYRVTQTKATSLLKIQSTNRFVLEESNRTGVGTRLAVLTSSFKGIIGRNYL
jgi:hypothetical protein